MRMTEAQATMAAELVAQLRHDHGMARWDHAGIMARLRDAAPTASAWDVTRALLALAENPELRTPALLPQPGPHWSRPDGSTPARRGDHTMRCPDHGEPYLRCGQCAAIKGGPPPADVRDEIRAALEDAKTTHAQRTAADRDRAERKTSR